MALDYVTIVRCFIVLLYHLAIDLLLLIDWYLNYSLY